MAADSTRIFVVSGTQGAGKTTVSAALARRFDRGVHLSGDVLHKMIVSGGQWPDAGAVRRETGAVPGEAGAQLRLRLHHACLLARSFYAQRFTVVIDDIIFGDRMTELFDDLGDLPLHIVMLVPDVATVRAREQSRGTELWREWEWLSESIMRSEPRIGLWLDTSELTHEQTVDAILARAEDARVTTAGAIGDAR